MIGSGKDSERTCCYPWKIIIGKNVGSLIAQPEHHALSKSVESD